MNLLLHGDYSFFFKKGNKSNENETFKLQKPVRKGFCVLHLALVLGFLYVAIGGANAQTIRYVRAGATGTGTTSWANASGDLQEMINSSADGDQVWVAAGTYYPNRRPDNLTVITPKDLNNAFVLKSNVKIYGGFAGNETSLKQRDSTRATNNTLLSGDVVPTSWHLYHVVMSIGEVGTAELNSFTISGGNANGNPGSNPQPTFGGGLYISSSSPVLSNITISGNTATDYGGGLYISSSSPVLTNVIISGNKANYGGGICNFSESSPVLTNVIISGNLANYGGGMFNYQSSSPALTNITISGNNAGYGGGAYNSANSSPKIRNTIIYGNSSGIWNNDGAYSKPIISYSLVQGSADITNGNIDGNTNPKFVILIAGLSTGGDFRLQPSSPAINAGSNAYFNAGQLPDLSAITTDLDGQARIQAGIIDLGAYESVMPVAPPTLDYEGVNASYPTGTAITDIIPTVTGTPLIGNGSFSNTTTTLGSGFSYPTGVAVDAAGNVYVADIGHNAVKEILAGHLTDGTPPATIGSGFKYPYGVAVDAAGNVYVADYGNGVVKEILAGHLADGTTPTIIGSGFKNPYGVAVDAAGNVYVADFGNSMIKVIPAGHLTDGTTPTIIGSGFKNPTGMAVDAAGNVYVADNGNGLVKKMLARHLTDGTAPATIGSGFSNPYSVAVDSAGNVFVADQVNGVKKIPAGHLTDGTAPTTIGSGFNQAIGVATDAAGNLYVADYGNNAVKGLKAIIYSISPALPAGLSIDSTTGIISGTPAVAMPSTSYTITTQNAGGAATATISFGVWSVLAVKWIEVNGSLNSSNNAVLNWKVAEQNIDGFHVQKSSDGIDFTTIGSLNSKGNGTNSYTYTDAATDKENSFYRIEEIDFDGKSNFSPIINLKSIKTSTITIYPNPTEGPLTVLVPNSLVSTNAILADVSGKTISVIKLSNNSNLINLGKVASGIYFLKFADGNVREIIMQ